MTNRLFYEGTFTKQNEFISLLISKFLRTASNYKVKEKSITIIPIISQEKRRCYISMDTLALLYLKKTNQLRNRCKNELGKTIRY